MHAQNLKYTNKNRFIKQSYVYNYVQHNIMHSATVYKQVTV